MELIERYLHEVGRHLPRKNRADILTELRSLIIDTLEGQVEGEASEEEISAVLKEFGPPREVAASYSSRGQYLVGPGLYPLFRMVVAIVLAAVVGAQLLALGIAIWVAGEMLNPWNALAGILNSIPAAFGSVVIVFAILQWFDVRPELDDKPWDPQSLPELEDREPVKRGERIFGLAAASLLLAVVIIYPEWIGFVNTPGGEFFANPVIPHYLPWISASLLASIALDIYLLWQGRWTVVSRVARLGVNVLSIVVLALLLQGHNAWLAERGASGFFTSLVQFAEDMETSWQLFGMEAFRLAFGVALIVTSIETAVQVYRLLRSALGGDAAPVVIKL